MKFFINTEVLKKVKCDKKRFKRKNSELTILEYLETENVYKDINFIFSNLKRRKSNVYKNNIILSDITLEEINKDTYHINQIKSLNKEDYMYALISSNQKNNNIFIPKKMQKKVQIIRKINFDNNYREKDCTKVLSDIYLIKIVLNTNEFLPIYFENDHKESFIDYIFIYKDQRRKTSYDVALNLKTVLKDLSKDKEYINLSSL